MRNIILIVFSMLLLSSCSKKVDNLCATTEPPEPTVQVTIVDSEGNSLIGEENTYKPSEIKLTKGNQNIPLRYFEYNGKTIMLLDYYEIETEKDYALKLNEQETDILNLKIKTYSSECFEGLKGVEKFLLNGEEIQHDANFGFVIQK